MGVRRAFNNGLLDEKSFDQMGVRRVFNNGLLDEKSISTIPWDWGLWLQMIVALL